MSRNRRLRVARGIVILLLLAIAAGCATIARGTWEAPRRVATCLPPPPFRSTRELAPERVSMLLTIEDPRFFEHRGVDFRTPGAGWTTISQGLVKILYFDDFRPGPLAKLEQTLLAVGFDYSTPKQAQLDLFWNLAYLGRVRGTDVNGFPRAADVYFDRDVASLEEREYLALVAMLIAPNRLSVASAPEANARRVARIERLLAGDCRPTGWRDVDLAGCADRER